MASTHNSEGSMTENSSVRETREEAQDSLGDVFSTDMKSEDARLSVHAHLELALTQLADLERDREALALFTMKESRRAQVIYEDEDVIVWNMSGEELVKRFDAAGTQEARDGEA